MPRQQHIKAARNSGIEFLKIIAILLIVLSHVTQTLSQESAHTISQDYVICLGNASGSIRILLLTLFLQAGNLGNNIFFICSAWFLVGSSGKTNKKAFNLLCTVWAISVLILILYLVVSPGQLSKTDIIRQLLPTTFSNNWYITAYILFLFIYPFLNQLIFSSERKQLLRVVLFSSFLWILMDYLKSDLFFPSVMLLWITVYFLTAYLKLYCPKLISDKKAGCILLILGIAGYCAQVIVTDFAGLHITAALSSGVLRWNSNCCPFYIMTAIGAVILFSGMHFTSGSINYISGLSLYIYLFHENYLFRTYTRPYIWYQIYLKTGHAHVVLADLIFALLLFIASAIVSALYRTVLEKPVRAAAAVIYKALASIYLKVENHLLNTK